MSRDIYPSLTAASAAQKHLEHIANNLSNVNTIGYKERRVSFETVLAGSGAGPLAEGSVKLSDGQINQETGPLLQDNVKTHLALRGSGFFVVENGSGEQFLTRSGNFQMDNNGFLVNQRGEKLQTQSGSIQLDDFQRDQFSIATDGRFLDENGAEFAQLLVMEGDDLEPLPGTRWKGENFREVEIGTIQVEQGFLEGSNVNPFRTMIEMMETTRHLALHQKTLQSSQQMDSSLNQMARRT
jgi:flagellar basal body rod protein FlgG